MNLFFKTKVTYGEEVDYDNNRLGLVGYLVDVTTHMYEDHKLSTDEVISLFDGGYRFGLIEQLNHLEIESHNFHSMMSDQVNKLNEFMAHHGIDFDARDKYTSKVESIFTEFHLSMKSNLTKKFDICQSSNNQSIRDEGVKERGESFLSQLYYFLRR